MARDDDLDAWFAKADDVLRTWDDSPDAMRAGVGDADPELPYIPDGRDVSFPLRKPTARRPGPIDTVRRMLRRRLPGLPGLPGRGK